MRKLSITVIVIKRRCRLHNLLFVALSVKRASKIIKSKGLIPKTN
ncbi:hypothetical protein HMPREF3204_00676 [Gardnerella pickettii]|nr:hypothetical protein HMPREF3204_00676 [Gardnerella pickettii]